MKKLSSPLNTGIALFISTGMLLGMTAASGCSSPDGSMMTDDGGTADAGDAMLPADAYGTTAPSGATIDSASDYAAFQQTPGFTPVTSHSLADQAAQDAKTLAADMATISAASIAAGDPSGTKFLPAAPTPGSDARSTTVLQADGNLAHTVKLNDGTTKTFTTMGNLWNVHAVATTLRVVGTFSNQLSLYTKVYSSLSRKTIDELSLVDPSTINSTTYTAADVAILNIKLATNFKSIIGTPVTLPVNPAPRTCGTGGNSADVGQGLGGDFGFAFGGNDSVCAMSPTGIFLNYAFPAKADLTCVKDQANRGTCIAFSSASAIEAAIHQTHGNYVNLSEQALYNRDTTIWDPRVYGDGTYSSDMLGGLETDNWLIPFENEANYNPSDWRQTFTAADGTTVTGYADSCNTYSGTCSDTAPQGKFVCTPISVVGYQCGFAPLNVNPGNEGYRVTTHSEVWNPANPQLATALIALATVFQNPVIWSFSVTPSWDGNNNGFVSFNAGESNRGGHANHIVGYISNEQLAQLLPNAPQAPTNGYFITKNSWNTCFGDGGYMYVPWDYVATYTREASILHGVQ